ncbi:MULTISPECIES: DUF5713 family protein [Streptomyces]|uniref:Uncharacterized protein n=1 Tax=Streptomyces pseudovenezuelae TaxID=67350 RepID=A0A101N894_9ACTN|nr:MULTISPECIES: DUF5713 family protein [Streptomyces]KUM88363.1 hypothetical protein AQI94_14480 [Streptomyces pseudovenezuelae]
MNIGNQQVATHPFLKALYRDGYYPDRAVDRGKEILLRLCERIEADRPADLAALYVLTQAATEEFNDLQDDDFDIETVAREEIAEEFRFIARTYGFEDADVEELIGTRDW